MWWWFLFFVFLFRRKERTGSVLIVISPSSEPLALGRDDAVQRCACRRTGISTGRIMSPFQIYVEGESWAGPSGDFRLDGPRLVIVEGVRSGYHGSIRGGGGAWVG